MMDILPTVLAVVVVVFAIGLAWAAIQIVPQSKVFVVERFGRYRRTLLAGLNLIVPILDRVAHRVSIIERQLPTFRISVITRDNVEVDLDATVFFRVVEAEKSVYRIQEVDRAILDGDPVDRSFGRRQARTRRTSVVAAVHERRDRDQSAVGSRGLGGGDHPDGDRRCRRR